MSLMHPPPDDEMSCRNCGVMVTGKFCSECGEKKYSAHDRSFFHLAHEAFHFLTHFEGKFFTTIKTMFRRPGQVSRDFVSGVRKKYFKPISFYLLLVIAYLLFPIFEGLNMKLQYYYNNRLFGSYAVATTQDYKIKEGVTEEALADRFAQKAEKTSKFLLFIIIPFMALVTYLFGFRKTSYFFDHFIFATELTSFFILFGYLLIPLLLLLFSLAGLKLFSGEGPIGIVIHGALAIYASFASSIFFGFRWWMSLAFGLFFTVALSFVTQFIYKFILFNVVMFLL